jgi:hypothetical protein
MNGINPDAPVIFRALERIVFEFNVAAVIGGAEGANGELILTAAMYLFLLFAGMEFAFDDV